MWLPRWVAAGAFAIAIGQIGVALSPSLPWALLAFTATGWGTVLSMAGNNTLIQSAVADDKRSRVMGLFATGQGMFPLGAIAAGGIAPRGQGSQKAGLERHGAAQKNRAPSIKPGPDLYSVWRDQATP